MYSTITSCAFIAVLHSKVTVGSFIYWNVSGNIYFVSFNIVFCMYELMVIEWFYWWHHLEFFYNFIFLPLQVGIVRPLRHGDFCQTNSPMM